MNSHNELEQKFMELLFDSLEAIQVNISDFTSMIEENRTRTLENNYDEVNEQIQKAMDILSKIYGKYILYSEKREPSTNKPFNFEIKISPTNYSFYDAFTKLQDESF